MSNTITSKTIGSLKQHDRLPHWWVSSKITIPFFGEISLPITYEIDPDDQDFMGEADDAIKNFLNLTIDDRSKITHFAEANCREFLTEVGEDELLAEIEAENDIWKFIYPTDVFVSRRPYQEQDIYVQIACNCEWEQEHGLQLVFRRGLKLTRISEQDGHLTEADAWGKPDEEDELLSKF